MAQKLMPISKSYPYSFTTSALPVALLRLFETEISTLAKTHPPVFCHPQMRFFTHHTTVWLALALNRYIHALAGPSKTI
jgi:hypothetical protein